MKSAGPVVLLCLATLSLSGCGSTMRGYLEKDTPTEQVAVRQDLTMPPDLRLPPPGTTAAAPDPGALSTQNSLSAAPPAAPLTVIPGNTPAAAPRAVTPAPVTTATTTAAASGPDAIYVNAGISVTNPDGTRKSDQQLRAELQAYYIAQKKAKNPNYGSVFNMGNIFKDE
ncbi:hypothetical protein [Aestuariivirga sp.]|uniref:hypothetical protein n=1 Tax=Aestuariivirga sp. TaxID=2650926 RepID=UPI003BAC98CA